jgi:hypothetical protein
VNALAGAPAEHEPACGAKRSACPAVPRVFPGHGERRAPRAVIRDPGRDPGVSPPRVRASTAPRVTEGRLWVCPPVRDRPVSGGQVVRQAATRDHRSRAGRVPAAPLEASPVRGRPPVGGLRDRRDPELSRAASPGRPSRRTTPGPARPEQRSRPEPTCSARQHPPLPFHRQRNEEACRDPPKSSMPSYAPGTGRPPGQFMVVQTTTLADHYRSAKELCQLFPRPRPDSST